MARQALNSDLNLNCFEQVDLQAGAESDIVLHCRCAAIRQLQMVSLNHEYAIFLSPIPLVMIMSMAYC